MDKADKSREAMRALAEIMIDKTDRIMQDYYDKRLTYLEAYWELSSLWE